MIDGGKVDCPGSAQRKRIRAASAVNGDFRAPVVDCVVASAGHDHISASTTMDGICTRAGGDRVVGGRARDGHCRGEQACIQVLEIADVHAVAGRLIGAGSNREIDIRDAASGDERQGIATRATVDG